MKNKKFSKKKLIEDCKNYIMAIYDSNGFLMASHHFEIARELQKLLFKERYYGTPEIHDKTQEITGHMGCLIDLPFIYQYPDKEKIEKNLILYSKRLANQLIEFAPEIKKYVLSEGPELKKRLRVKKNGH